MEEHASVAANKIVLDIGGQRFATAKSTLLSQKNTFFDAMLSSGQWRPGDDGVYFVDRNPEFFPIILDFLRLGKIKLRDRSLLPDLIEDLDFYQIKIPDEVLHPIGDLSLSTLLNAAQKQSLIDFLESPKSLNTTLLYKASRDGFGAAAFHQKCDASFPTLVIVRSTEGHLFGGYATATWSGSQYRNDAGCFLFSLANPTGTRVKIAANNNGHNMYCVQNYGPTFGGNHDLHISDNSNVNTNSYTNLGNAFVGQTNFLFVGNRTFQTTEIEVYSVVKTK